MFGRAYFQNFMIRPLNGNNNYLNTPCYKPFIFISKLSSHERDGSPTTITSCVAIAKPEVLGDFFLFDVLLFPVLGVDEFAVAALRFRLVLAGRTVSAEWETRDHCIHALRLN